MKVMKLTNCFTTPSLDIVLSVIGFTRYVLPYNIVFSNMTRMLPISRISMEKYIV